MVDIPFRNGRSVGKLREIEMADLDELASICKDEYILKAYFGEVPKDMKEYWGAVREDSLEYIAEGANDPNYLREKFSLVIDIDRHVVGFMSYDFSSFGEPYFRLVGAKDGSRNAEVSFFVGTEHRGQRIADNALKASLPYLFGVAKADLVTGVCDRYNAPSQKLMERCGLEKLWEGPVVRVNDDTTEVTVMGLTRDRYREKCLMRKALPI